MTGKYKYPRIATISAILPLVVLIYFLFVNVKIFGDNALGGSNQWALLMGAMIGAIVAVWQGVPWKRLYEGILHSLHSSLGAILILLLIGGLSGIWMVSGIVPTMVYYGLKILSPGYFLPAACIVCCIVSLSTGSSWSTVATVGLALLGIGKAMGFSEGIIAGAIISGAYFGDKMSPLSDTTNLAPAMAGTGLFTHIRYMTYTTIPSIVISILLFLIIGLNYTVSGDVLTSVNTLEQEIQSIFFISPWLLLVPVVVIILILKKMPAFPALFAGIVLAIIPAMFQNGVIAVIAGDPHPGFYGFYKAIVKSITESVTIPSKDPVVAGLLSTKGMNGMLNTIWLIICAMTFGGVMESSGFLIVITEKIIALAKSVFSLFFSTVVTCFFFNLVTADQYLAIVVPGKMFEPIYRRRGLAPENLSRTLEDSGTVTSVLIPWNTCGATQASVLGVATGTYWMYCFFNLISPVMTLIFALFNIKIRHLDDQAEN